jgi:hypothetical protein
MPRTPVTYADLVRDTIDPGALDTEAPPNLAGIDPAGIDIDTTIVEFTDSGLVVTTGER